MKEIKINIYTFDELDKKAKEKARQWFRESSYGDEWWDSIYEDAATIGLNITSFDLDRNRHAMGRLLSNTEIVAANIVKKHGDKTETHILAASFLKEFNKEKDEENREQMSEEFERSLLEEYAVILQRESEYLASDEAVDESIIANEYTFTKDGKRFG